MEYGTRHAIRNLWMLILGSILVVASLVALTHQPVHSATPPSNIGGEAQPR